jgi:hypothetical protein
MSTSVSVKHTSTLRWRQLVQQQSRISHTSVKSAAWRCSKKLFIAQASSADVKRVYCYQLRENTDVSQGTVNGVRVFNACLGIVFDGEPDLHHALVKTCSHAKGDQECSIGVAGELATPDYFVADPMFETLAEATTLHCFQQSAGCHAPSLDDFDPWED